MKDETKGINIYDATIRLFITLVVINWCLLFMAPFISIMLWGMILSLAIYPLYQPLSKKIGASLNWLLLFFFFSIFAITLVPAMFLVGSLAKEVKELKVSNDNGIFSIPPPTEKVKVWPLIGKKLYNSLIK